jgi:hypothetical protein
MMRFGRWLPGGIPTGHRGAALTPCKPESVATARKTSEAVDAFDRTTGLAEDPAVSQFLLQRRG